jgi:hypothetical protein
MVVGKVVCMIRWVRVVDSLYESSGFLFLNDVIIALQEV